MEDLRYDLLFYAAQESIVRVDRGFNIIDINDSFEALFKYPRKEVIGAHIDTIFAVDKDIEKIRRNTLRVLDGSRFYDQGQRIDKNGDYHDVLITGIPVMKDDAVEGAFISYKDITAEKRAVEALESQKNILSALFSYSPDAIVRFDAAYKVVEINQRFIDLFQFELEELYGQTLEQYICTLQSSGDAVALTEKLIRGEAISTEGVRFGKNGIAKHVSIRGVPIMKDHLFLGGFGIYTDISKRKQSEEAINFMSYHDALTGLYNRRFFEEEINRLNTLRNLPLGMIMCDANGLKLTNDIFGHQSGDTLLVKIADILKGQCRQDEIIARLGGDEFVVLLPKTSLQDVETICTRILEACGAKTHCHLPVSVSFGYAVKTEMEETTDELFKRAEDMMYAQKLNESAKHKRKTIETLMVTLHKISPYQAAHNRGVSHLCEEIAKAVGLTSKEIQMAKTVGWYHDIGKIGISDPDDQQLMRKHPEIGSRIVSAVGDLIDYADIILAHHENYDGSGYPKGLKESGIPLLSRIVAVADAFENLTNPHFKDGNLECAEALKRIEQNTCIKYDPIIVGGLKEIIQERKHS